MHIITIHVNIKKQKTLQAKVNIIIKNNNDCIIYSKQKNPIAKLASFIIQPFNYKVATI
jgi:hypothetical protein